MSRNSLIKKGLVVAVILLFIGVSVIPSTGTVVEKKFSMPTNYDGNTLYVGGSGSGNYTKIQDAIDNASDGDTVFVYDDSSPYYENVVVHKSINLFGENRDTTIIWNTLEYNGCCVKITGNLVNISGFGITNSSCSSPGINMLSSKKSIICNCSLYNNYGDMWIQNSFNISIIKCDIFESMQEGIMFYNTDYSQIRKCNIYNNRAYGIYTDASIYNTIEDCNFLNHDVGIYLDFSSHNTNIRKCKIFNNRDAGIRMGRSNFTVVENCIISNSQLGIFFIDSNYNSITENIITSSLEYGINIYEGNDNIIYHNNLINNSLNAYDDGSNTWDNGYPSGGNYWDDYNGVDNDGDGIGDIPYNIPGGDNQDRYPLMEPFVQYPEFDVSGRGGIGLKVSITNVGDIAATNVEWMVSVKGGLLGLINLSENGSLNSLDIGESISLALMPFGFGLLKISIEIDASNAEKQIFKGRFFVILFIVFPTIPPLYWSSEQKLIHRDNT